MCQVLHACHFQPCRNDVGASLVAQLVKNLPAMQETRVRCLDWEESLEQEMATNSSIFAWEIPRTDRSLEGYGPWHHESQMRLSTQLRNDVEGGILAPLYRKGN